MLVGRCRIAETYVIADHRDNREAAVRDLLDEWLIQRDGVPGVALALAACCRHDLPSTVTHVSFPFP